MAILNFRRVLLIVNPASNRGRVAREVALATLRGEGAELTVCDTTGPGDATQLAATHAPEHDAVFSLGGDGTVSEIARVLAGTSTPLGILAAGTGNLVARSLAIPLRTQDAVKSLLTGRLRRIDVARMGDGRVSVFAAGTGIDAEMVTRATGAMKRRWGVATYFVTATQAAFARQGFQLRATVDGREVATDAWAAFVANFGDVLGGLIHLGPDIRPDDGMLDLCVLSPTNVREAVAVTWRLLTNDFRPHPHMQFHQGKEIVLVSDPRRPVQFDGEPAGETPASFCVEAGALTVIVPTPR